MTPMTPKWSEHALARAYERGAAWTSFCDEVDQLAKIEAWEIWYEFDPRNDRGVQTNYVVHTADGTVAILRNDRFSEETEHARRFVISVITKDQADRNELLLWAKTPAAAIALHRQRENGRLVGRPLTHKPLGRLVQRR